MGTTRYTIQSAREWEPSFDLVRVNSKSYLFGGKFLVIYIMILTRMPVV